MDLPSVEISEADHISDVANEEGNLVVQHVFRHIGSIEGIDFVFRSGPVQEADADLILMTLGLREAWDDRDESLNGLDRALSGLLYRLSEGGLFSGVLLEVMTLSTPTPLNAEALTLIGLGAPKSIPSRFRRSAMTTALLQCARSGARTAALLANERAPLVQSGGIAAWAQDVAACVVAASRDRAHGAAFAPMEFSIYWTGQSTEEALIALEDAFRQHPVLAQPQPITES